VTKTDSCVTEPPTAVNEIGKALLSRFDSQRRGTVPQGTTPMGQRHGFKVWFFRRSDMNETFGRFTNLLAGCKAEISSSLRIRMLSA
jgi:hypothetical protein